MVVISIARWGYKPFSILNLTSFPRFDHGLPSSSQRNGGSGQLGKSGPVQEPACGSILQSCPVFGQWSKESANPHHVDGWTSDWICLGVRTFGGVWRHGVYVKLRPTSKIKDFLNGTNTCIQSLEHAGGYNVNPPSLWSLKMVLATLSLPRFKLWMVIIFDILILVAMSGVVNLKENWVLWSNFYFSWNQGVSTENMWNMIHTNTYVIGSDKLGSSSKTVSVWNNIPGLSINLRCSNAIFFLPQTTT
jgi:hypothetical protein